MNEVLRAMLLADPRVASFKHFDVSKDVATFANEASLDRLPDDNSEVAHESLPVPLSSRIPAGEMTLTVDGWSLGFVLKDLGNSQVLCGVFDGAFHHLGVFEPGKPTKVKEGAWGLDRMAPESVAFLVDWLAFIVALINEPRVVKLGKPEMSRQQRRREQRGFGLAVDAWTRVSWDLSRPTVAARSRDPDFHNMPLHWCRGHYRRAESHFVGAVQRPDAFRQADRTLWWQWIDGHWRGHPAFGVKKSIHAPSMSSGFLAPRGGYHERTAA